MLEEGDGPGDTTPSMTTVHMGLHGTAPVFDSIQEEWPEYAERLNSYFLANDLKDPVKKQAILVNAVGPKTYRLIKTLCFKLLEKPQDHSFEEIVKRSRIIFTLSRPPSCVATTSMRENRSRKSQSLTSSPHRRRLRVQSGTRRHATQSASVWSR